MGEPASDAAQRGGASRGGGPSRGDAATPGPGAAPPPGAPPPQRERGPLVGLGRIAGAGPPCRPPGAAGARRLGIRSAAVSGPNVLPPLVSQSLNVTHETGPAGFKLALTVSQHYLAPGSACLFTVTCRITRPLPSVCVRLWQSTRTFTILSFIPLPRIRRAWYR